MSLNKVELSNFDGDPYLLAELLWKTDYIIVPFNVTTSSPEILDSFPGLFHISCALHVLKSSRLE
jgi:hypothetical protein